MFFSWNIILKPNVCILISKHGLSIIHCEYATGVRGSGSSNWKLIQQTIVSAMCADNVKSKYLQMLVISYSSGHLAIGPG